MKFNPGKMVMHKLTGEIVMILEPIRYVLDENCKGINGYWIRTTDYEVVKVAEFELMERA